MWSLRLAGDLKDFLLANRAVPARLRRASAVLAQDVGSQAAPVPDHLAACGALCRPAVGLPVAQLGPWCWTPRTKGPGEGAGSTLSVAWVGGRSLGTLPPVDFLATCMLVPVTSCGGGQSWVFSLHLVEARVVLGAVIGVEGDGGLLYVPFVLGVVGFQEVFSSGRGSSDLVRGRMLRLPPHVGERALSDLNPADDHA